ncbi:MAG: Rid family hydrolase [Myxococcota bacterium]
MADEKFQRVYSHAPWEAKVGYCRALRAGPHIYVTGTAPVTEDGSTFAPGDGYRQAALCLELIEQALHKLGAGRADIVRTRMFVTDIDRWPEFGRDSILRVGAEDHRPGPCIVLANPARARLSMSSEHAAQRVEGSLTTK